MKLILVSFPIDAATQRATNEASRLLSRWLRFGPLRRLIGLYCRLLFMEVIYEIAKAQAEPNVTNTKQQLSEPKS
jgi:hypothetical protein